MRSDGLRRMIRRGGIALLVALVLTGGAAGCDLLPPASPAVPPASPTPRVVVYTATPRPSLTARPPTSTPLPETSTPRPSPTVPATPPTATHTPAASPSPTVAAYQLEAWVLDPRPVRGGDEFVYARLTYRGQGAARAWMYVICHYRVLNVRWPQSGFVETDATGLGRVAFNTTPATSGETVLVDVYVQYAGNEYRVQTSFQPR